MTVTPEDVEALRELWQIFFKKCPVDSQFALWLAEHPSERMVYAITRVGVRYAMRTLSRYELWYCVKLATKLADDEQREEWSRNGRATSAPTKTPLVWYAFNSEAQHQFAKSQDKEERAEMAQEASPPAQTA
jgi:hypothetical protein